MSFLNSRRNQMQDPNVDPADVRQVLDDLILGRLRIASKGQMRGGPSGELVNLDKAQQAEDGMYMLGQVATLRHSQTTVSDLHEAVVNGAREMLVNRVAVLEEKPVSEADPADVAIVGISCLMPGAR